MTSRQRDLARLRGQLDVLLGLREELDAIGASDERCAKADADIARVRAELSRIGYA